MLNSRIDCTENAIVYCFELELHWTIVAFLKKKWPGAFHERGFPPALKLGRNGDFVLLCNYIE